ncbi:hypothetical protein [Nocardioides zeae]
MLVSGQRRVAAGGATDLLLHEGAAFLVDRSTSSISRIDPSTTDAIGERWVATEGLADATIDGRGHVWAIDGVGTLVELRWSDAERRFVTEDEEDVDYAGDGSVLVGHDRGVTVFGPDAGIVVQVGTGDDVVGDAPSLVGTLLAPASAPADLAPVSSPRPAPSSSSGPVSSARSTSPRSPAASRDDRRCTATSSTCRATAPAASSCSTAPAAAPPPTSPCPATATPSWWSTTGTSSSTSRARRPVSSFGPTAASAT